MSISKQKIFDNHVLRLIHSKGFKAMTMRDIAQSMNCDVANIYNYTNSKAALLEKFLFDISHRFHDAADKILASQLSPEDKLKAIIRVHIQLSETRPYEVALLINEYRNLTPDQFKRFTALRDAYEHKIGALIQSGIEEGYFRPVNTAIMIPGILGCLRWMYDKFVDGRQHLNPFDIEENLVSFIIGGLRNTPNSNS
jgi:AcrR family transcriptional regulator